jgi:quinol monooxygenase YgiN
MRRITTAAAALAVLALAGAVSVQAQEGSSENPAFVSVEVFEVAPADQAGFTAAVRKIVRAAREAELAERFAWDVYQRDDVFQVVSWHASLTDFEDPDLWYRQFRDTPGQATIEEAFADMAGMDVHMTSAVHRAVSDWSYQPEDPAVEPGGPPTGIFVLHDRLAFGSEEAYAENTRKVMAMLGEVGYRYPVHGHRTVIGEGGQAIFAVLHDGEENFHGENDLAKLLEASGKGEAWGELMGERMSLLRDHETYNVTYRPDLSYHAGGDGM